MEEQVTDIRETLGVLWRRRILILAIAAAVAVGAIGLSIGQPKTFVAKSRLVVRPVVQQQSFSPTGSRPVSIGGDISIESQAEILSSPVIAERVAGRLAISTPPGALARSIHVRVITDELLEIQAASGSAQHAAAVANAFAEEFIVFRQEAARETLRQIASDLDTQLAGLEGRVKPLDDRIVALQVEIVRLQTTVAQGTRRAQRVATLRAEIDRLEAERNELVVQRGLLRVRREEVRANELGTIGGGQIIEPATIPRGAASPKPKRDGIVGLLLGLIVGSIVAFVRERFDDRIRTQAEAARAAGVPLLGAVPRSRGWRRKKEAFLVTVSEPGAPAAESFRTLRQSLSAMGIGRHTKTVMVTSGGRGAGKSAAAANLGVSFAQAGHRVAVVSGDLRRPRLQSFFGLRNEKGLAQVLEGTVSPVDALTATKVPGLMVLPSGTIPSNAAALLDSRRLDEAMAALRTVVDVIIIDAPALLAGADALVLAACSDVTVLAMRQDEARADGTAAAVASLRQAGAHSIAGILTVVRGGTRRRHTFEAPVGLPIELHVSSNGHGPEPAMAASEAAPPAPAPRTRPRSNGITRSRKSSEAGTSAGTSLED